MDLRKIGALNVLLVCVPAALMLKGTDASEPWIFVVSAAAIIPLAGLMGKSTEMLAERVGPGLGGLLNASFGNAAEFIIAVSALRRGLVDVVKASLTGSILGNVLLILGASFFVGGIRHRSGTFNPTAAGMSATLLVLAAVGLLVPAVFHAHLVFYHETAPERELSLEISVVLFAVYMLMLLFSLKTHRHLYSNAAISEPERQRRPERTGDAPLSDSEPHWPVWVSVTVLLVSAAVVAVMSELLVGAVEATSRQFGWTELFVGVVVVAIVGNAAEHSTAILVASKNRMDLSFQIAVGSALQIALFVAPLLVFLGYLPGLAQLDLLFSMLEVVAVVVSVLIVGLVAYDGKSNWMEGMLLMAVYVILAIAFYHLPEPATAPHSL